IDGFKTPDENDMGTPNPGNSFYKDRISYFPRTSDKIKEQAVKQVQWVDGSSLSTGKRVIELTLDNRKTELFTVPDDIDVLPGGKISKENLEKLKEAIRKQYQKVNTNGQVVGNVPTITETTPVWVKKQVKVTYYDNENNSSTNNQDDSVDYVDVLFKNIRKEIAPTTPTVSTPTDGSVSVTPNGTTDKLVVSYRPNNQNSDTTITVKKSGTTWGTLDTLPNGVKVNSSNGIVSIAEPTVKDESTVIAKATYLNSDEASATGVAKNPDNVAPTVTLNGTTLTDNASNKTVHVFRGSSLELPLKYYDNAATGRVNISYKNDGGLPQGVWFNDNANASSNYTIKQNGKTVNSQGSYTVRGNISNTASLGERPITLKVSDSADGNVDSGNKKEVKFNVRTYDIEPNSTKVTVEKGTTLSEQDAKAAVTKVNGALDLPEGTTYEWVDTNGRNQTVTPNTAGVQNYRVKVTLPSSETGNNAAFRSSKIVNVSVNVRPEAPTITTEEKYKGTLVSTERSISGTGHPGATVKITLQDGTTVREVTVENNGKWKYNLASNEKLTQNDKDSTVKASNPISVKQVVNNIESVAKTVDVQMGRAISVATPVKAGRDISVKLPHDTALFYLQIKNGSDTVQYDVKLVDGNWKIIDAKVGTTDLTVSSGDNISEKVFTLHIKDSNRKENIPFRINDGTTIQVRAHYVNGSNNPANPTDDGGWAVAAPATNTNPAISVANQNTTYISDGTLTKDKLKTLVNVTDAEDDNNKTVGNSAKENLDVTVTKDGQSVDLTKGKALKQGTYNLTYTTTDAAGARVTRDHTLKVNYTVQARATINLVQGETVSDELKRSLVQLRDGNDVIDVPRNARVDVAVDTSAKTDSNKQAQATVVLADGTRLAPVTLSYRVLPTFPIAHTVYDFKNVARSDNESGYYVNTGNLPGGMVWVAKRGSEQEKNASELKGMLASDPLGETTYKFGGKYNYGRFTNSPQATEKLEHTGTLTHKVFDIEANPTKVTVEKGATLTEQNAKDSVTKVTGSANLPDGTTYEWVGTPDTNTPGVRTYKVRVTLPVSQTGQNQPDATQKRPFKIIDVKVNVKPEQPTVKTTIQPKGNIRIPTVSSTDRELTGTGLPNAKVKVNVSGTELNEVTVGRDGTWESNTS
ncbi:Rib/alpha-like repeat protein, partial [Streptococcus mitis SK1080]